MPKFGTHSKAWFHMRKTPLDQTWITPGPPSSMPAERLAQPISSTQHWPLPCWYPHSLGRTFVPHMLVKYHIAKKQMGITTFKSPNRSKKTLLLCIELQIPNVPCAWHLLLLGHPSSHLAWELLQPSLRPGVLMLMPTMISLLMSSLLWEPHRE